MRNNDELNLINQLRHYNGWQCDYDGFGCLARCLHAKTQ